MDGLVHFRREVLSHLREEYRSSEVYTEKGLALIGSLSEVNNHIIVDRGELVGLWEFDPNAGKIAWVSFGKPTDELRAEIALTEEFVRDQLGDARSFSLDSPESRKPKLAALAAD